MSSSTNVDTAELAKFESLAARWWDPEAELKSLHDINPLRLGYIQERASLAGKSVVDIGCGGGILAESMAGLGARVTGIDLAEASIAVARLHLNESARDVEYRCISAEDLARERSGAYDVVSCMELLEHVPEPASTVAACASLVKPGGHVFFSTINRNPKAWLYAIVGAEYILNLLPRGTHEYLKFIRPSELERMCRASRLRVAGFIGLHYNPFARRYRLGPGVEVNYIAHARRMED